MDLSANVSVNGNDKVISTQFCSGMVFPAKPGSQKRQHESLEEDAAHDRRGTNGTTACEPGGCIIRFPLCFSCTQQSCTIFNSLALKRRRVFDFGAHPRRKIALQFLYHGWEFDGLVQQASTDNTVEEVGSGCSMEV